MWVCELHQIENEKKQKVRIVEEPADRPTPFWLFHPLWSVLEAMGSIKKSDSCPI